MFVTPCITKVDLYTVLYVTDLMDKQDFTLIDIKLLPKSGVAYAEHTLVCMF